MTPLLCATDIALSGRLEKTSLAIGGGELVCVVGPNGSGKTSLLHALAGIGGASGSVSICGTPLKGLHPDRRQRLFSLLPVSRETRWPVSGADLVRLGLPVGCELERVIRDLELQPLMSRRADRLSTGERGRLLIARALAAEPSLLLLDEPLANLDPLWQLKLMDYLRRTVRSDRRAIVMAVHDLEVARTGADRLIVMNGGRIVADGPPQEILTGSVPATVFGVEWKDGRWRVAV